MQTLDTDILILGAGGAGLFAALHAKKARPELDVTIAVKGLLGKCGCTRMVQGGYNVALSAEDSVERHFMDTIHGGGWLNQQELAWLLVSTAPIRIRELENEIGCFFDRNPDGTVHQKAFAGQTFDRTVHKGDLTGIEIINRLAEQVWARGIARLEEHRALELILTADRSALAGVLLVDMRDGEYVLVEAQAVLLATGGGPTMYRFHTPSGDKSCDGMAMALAAGLPLRDMEMVQFHPTGLLAGAQSSQPETAGVSAHTADHPGVIRLVWIATVFRNSAAMIELAKVLNCGFCRRPCLAEKCVVGAPCQDVIAINHQYKFGIEIFPVIGILPSWFVHGKKRIALGHSKIMWDGTLLLPHVIVHCLEVLDPVGHARDVGVHGERHHARVPGALGVEPVEMVLGALKPLG